MTKSKVFKIKGYWKNDKTKFEDYYCLVSGVLRPYDDEEIFCYFDDMAEFEEAKNIINEFDFVITESELVEV